MTKYRVGDGGVLILSEEGKPVVRIRPGTHLVGRLDILVEPPKMRRVRSDKQRRAGRDYEAPEMAHEDKAR